MREKEPSCGPDVLTHGDGHASFASWGADPPPRQQLNHGVILCPPWGPASSFRKTLGSTENQRRGNRRVGMSSPRSEAQAEGQLGSAHGRAPRLARMRGWRGPQVRTAQTLSGSCGSALSWRHDGATFTGGAPMPPHGLVQAVGRILPFPVPCPPTPGITSNCDP